MSVTEALQWIARTFEEPVQRISADTSRDQIAAWDSLGVLPLMAALDQDFGIVLAAGEIQSLDSVAKILEVLRQRGKLTE